MSTYRFGEFELDLDAHELRTNGRPIHLERRPMGLLALLVRSPGKLIAREEVVSALWPSNVIIDFDSGLNTLVRKVRQALGDSSDNPRYIATVAGRGYRFIARVEASGEAAPVSEIETETEPAARSPVPRDSHRAIRISRTGTLVLVLIAVAAGVSWLRLPSDAIPGTRLAVMPFEDLTGDDSLGYLASGLAEETSISLARIDLPELSIIGGTSARAVDGRNLSARESGKQLNADYLVLSSLRREKSTIRVTSRLIDVRADEQIWSASFDRELTNLLGLQRELSIAIAEQIRQTLSPDVAAAIDRRQTSNPAAYELYLKGRHAWTRFTPTAVPQALDYYQQAVALDPGYALAWAGIAHALSTSPMTADAQPGKVEITLEDALERALEYGPDLAEVYLALQTYHLFISWDLAAAEAAGRRAIALDPDFGLAHMTFGIILAQRAKYVEANEVLKRARELDPFFPLIFANSANAALMAGDVENGLEFSRQAIAINPEFWVGHFHLGNALAMSGDLEAAIEAFARAERLSGGNSKPVASRAHALASVGRTDDARDILAMVESKAADEFVPASSLAFIYAGLHDNDAALQWLERALAERDVHLIGIEADWQMRGMQSDPRFQTFVERCRCGKAYLRASEVVSIEPASTRVDAPLADRGGRNP